MATSRADLWNYRAHPDPRSDHGAGVVDGDTLDLVFDLGLSSMEAETVRLAGVDTAETYGPNAADEYEDGVEQSEFVREWIVDAITHPEANAEWPLLVTTEKDESGKYGRLLATVTNYAGETLNEALIDEYPEVENAR